MRIPPRAALAALLLSFVLLPGCAQSDARKRWQAAADRQNVDDLIGILLVSDDAEALVAWYDQTLGIRLEFDADEDQFSGVIADRIGGGGSWMAIRQRRPDEVRPRLGEAPPSPVVLSFRVTKLYDLLDRLRGRGIKVESSKDRVYGRFAYIRDADGNGIELFEPKRDR